MSAHVATVHVRYSSINTRNVSCHCGTAYTITLRLISHSQAKPSHSYYLVLSVVHVSPRSFMNEAAHVQPRRVSRPCGSVFQKGVGRLQTTRTAAAGDGGHRGSECARVQGTARGVCLRAVDGLAHAAQSSGCRKYADSSPRRDGNQHQQYGMGRAPAGRGVSSDP